VLSSSSSSFLARLRRRFLVAVTVSALVTGTIGVQAMSVGPASAAPPYCYSVALEECGGGGGGSSPDPYPSVSGSFPQNIVIGVPVSAQFTGAGAPGPYSYSAALPGGLSINGNGLVEGTPTGPTGPFMVQVTVRTPQDVAGSSAYATTVNERPRFTGATSATVSTATPASVAVQATGYPAPTHTLVAGALPPGLSLSQAGLITGIPVDSATGPHAFTVLASNAYGEVPTTFTITVTETRPPAVGAQPATQTVTAGQPVTFTASAERTTSVQWQRSSGASGWVPIAGATSATYTRTTTSTDDGSSYRAVFSGPGGSTATTAAALTVQYAPVFPAPSESAWVAGRASSLVVTLDANPRAAISGSALAAWMSLTDNGDNTATLSGTPPVGAAGTTVVVSLAASNPVGASSGSTRVIVHRAPLVSDSPAGVTVTPGSAFSFSAAAGAGFPAPTVQWQRSADGGLSFSDVAGATLPSYAGVASVADDGARYRAVFTNSAGTATSSAATLRVGTAPAFSSAPSAILAEGVAGSVTVTATGTPLPVFSATGLPAWLTLANGAAGTATLSGTPPVDAEDVTVTLTAANTFDPTATQSVRVSVHRSAVFTSGSTATFTQGEANSFTVTTGAGRPADRTLSLVGTLPTGVTFRDNGDGTATIAGTPAARTGGLSTLRLVATTAGGVAAAVSQDLALTVEERPAFTTPDHVAFTAGMAATIAVGTRAGYPAATTLTAAGLPAGLGFVDNGDGTGLIHGTPLASSAGVSDVTITASNGVGSGTVQRLRATVDASPAFTSGYSTTFAQGIDNEFVVRTAGGFPVATAIGAAGALPAGVTLVDRGDGTALLSGRPAASSGGSYTLALTAQATGGSTGPRSQSFVLVVDELPSFTTADRLTARVGEPVDFAVGTTAGHPAARTLATGDALPAGLAFTDNGDGTGRITGTPEAAAAGVTPVTLVASNGLADDTSQTVSITVDASPAFASNGSAQLRVGESAHLSVSTSAGFPATTSITLAGGLPAGIVVRDNGDGTATLTGTPAAGAGGDYPVVFTATSVGGSSAPSTLPFTVTVFEPAAVTSAPTARFEVGSPGAFPVATTAGFPVSTTLALAGTLPAGLAFTDRGDGTAELAGTPRESGLFPVEVVASNGQTSTTQQLRVTVVAPPAIRDIAKRPVVIGVRTEIDITTRAGYPAATVVSLEGALPDGLRFTAAGDGTASITGSATPGSEGQYAVTVRATNGVGPDATTAVVVTVAAAAVVPLPASVPLSTKALLGVPDTATVSDSIDVRGTGFAPGSVVTLAIYSTPRRLGTVIADAAGGFSARLVLPADLTGEHTVVAAGTALDGDPLFLTSGISIAAERPTVTPSALPGATQGAAALASPADGGASTRVLAATGGDAGPSIWLALALLLAGIVLARGGARRGVRRGRTQA
jgi:hypothetical protein